jgi:VCBS repeat-containing protein
VTGISEPVTGSYGTLVLNADGSYSYTPDRTNPIVNSLKAGESRNDVFTYAIMDADGDIVTATLTITVIGANDAPVVIDPANPGLPGNPTPATDPDNIISDVALNDSDPLAPIDVKAFFADPEGSTLSFAATGLPAGLSIDPATGLLSGIIDPSASQGGPANDGIYTATITVTDADGGVATTTITFTVSNLAPQVNNEIAQYIEAGGLDVPASQGLLVNDNDPDRDALSITAFTLAGLPGSFAPDIDHVINGLGTIRINADGSYTLVTEAGFRGAIPVITYTVSDADGASTPATLTITRLPSVLADRLSVTEDQPVTVAAAEGLLANDRDPDGDPLQITGYAIDGVAGTIQPGTPTVIAGVGTITINADGSYSFVPLANFDGAIPAIRYTASDGKDGSSEGILMLSMTAVNDAPVAQNDVGTTDPDVPLRLDLLGNDSDVDGGTLTIASATSAHGSVTINADGSIIFVPKAGFAGEDALITYVVSDGKGGFATATVTIKVRDAAAIQRDAPAAFMTAFEVKSAGFRPNDTPAIGPGLALADASSAFATGAAAGLAAIDGGRYIEQAVALAGPAGSLESLNAKTLGERIAMLDDRTLGDRMFRNAAVAQDWGPAPFGFERVIGTHCGLPLAVFTQGNAHHIMLGVMMLSDSPIESMRVTLADGRPLPDHIRITSDGLVIVQRIGLGGPLDLELTLTSRDGEAFETRIRLNGETGEILFATEPKPCAPAVTGGPVLPDQNAALFAAFETFA